MSPEFSSNFALQKRKFSLIYGGGLCVLLFCWFTLFVMATATYFLIDWAAGDQKIVGTKIGVLDHSNSIAWIFVFVCASWLVGLLILAYLMGLMCAFFWHQLQLSEAPIGWSVIVLIFAISPTLVAGGLDVFLVVCILFFLGIFPIRRGLEVGMKWWPQRRYRQFFGLANDYERDDKH